MNITEDDIKLIIRLISEKLGPDASAEKIRSLAEEAINRLSVAADEKLDVAKSVESINEIKKPQKLIVNAFGLA